MNDRRFVPTETFPTPDGHPNLAAHHWLDAAIATLDATDFEPKWRPDPAKLLDRLDAEDPGFQIAVLKASIERLPWYRSFDRKAGRQYALGSLHYGLVCALYSRRLPLSEPDLCEILALSKHDCGHGGDVTAPFDLALAHARKHGVTPRLLAAIRSFVDNLTGIQSAKAQSLKRKASVLLLLDPSPRDRRTPCWSDGFRVSLATLPDKEQEYWQWFVTHITVNDQYVLPQTWRKVAEKFLKMVGREQTLTRLGEWWPDARRKTIWPLQTGGSHLLKSFVWLLEAGLDASAADAVSDELVRALGEIEWKPSERGRKVMNVAARYLLLRPPEIAWPALQRLANQSGDDPYTKIPDWVRDYAREHKCD